MKITKKHTWKHYKTGNPVSVIGHICLGTERGTTDWILNGPKSISYNYYITKQGEVIEFVPYNKGAWHSGVVHKPTKRAKDFFGDTNPNSMSIGICYEGRTVDTRPNQKQKEAGRELVAWLSKKVKIQEFFYHKEITSYKPEVVKEFVDAIKPIEVKENSICKLLRQLMKRYDCQCAV
jgi:N-acetyl-anhydromuramyl-L-alanine amidase AmpD